MTSCRVTMLSVLLVLVLAVSASLVSGYRVSYGATMTAASGASGNDFTSPAYWSTGSETSLSWMGVYLSGSSLIAQWTPVPGGKTTPTTISTSASSGATLATLNSLLYAFWTSGNQIQYASFTYAGKNPAWSAVTPGPSANQACGGRNFGAVTDYFTGTNIILMYEDSECSGYIYWSLFNGNTITEQGSLGQVTSGGAGLTGFFSNTNKEFAFHQGYNFDGFINYNSWDGFNWSTSSTTKVTLKSHPTAALITVDEPLAAVAYQRGGIGYFSLFDGNSFIDVDKTVQGASGINGIAGVGVSVHHGQLNKIRLSWVDSTGNFKYVDGTLTA